MKAFKPKPGEMQKQDKMKSCPFCGSEAEYAETVHGKTKKFYPSCTNENCIGYISNPHYTFSAPKYAINAWNARKTHG